MGIGIAGSGGSRETNQWVARRVRVVQPTPRGPLLSSFSFIRGASSHFRFRAHVYICAHIHIFVCTYWDRCLLAVRASLHVCRTDDLSGLRRPGHHRVACSFGWLFGFRLWWRFKGSMLMLEWMCRLFCFGMVLKKMVDVWIISIWKVYGKRPDWREEIIYSSVSLIATVVPECSMYYTTNLL